MTDSLRSGTNSSDFVTHLTTRESNYLLRVVVFRPLHEEISRKDYIYHSPVNRLTRLWNSLPEATRTNFLQQPIKETINHSGIFLISLILIYLASNTKLCNSIFT